MYISRPLLIILCCFSVMSSIGQAPFTAGNLVVLRVGDGTTPLTDGSRPVFLDEFSPLGILKQSIPMPRITNGSNHRFTLDGVSGDNTAETGMLNLSPNRQWLTATGYDTVESISNIFINDVIVKRTIAIVDYTGVVNTTTALSDVLSGRPYSSITTNGVDLWSCFAATGIRYSSMGSSTSTSVITGTNYRIVGINDNQLFATFRTGLIRNIGAGLPITGPQPFVNLPNIGPTLGQCQAFFVDMNSSIPGNDVIYVSHANLGLCKYSFDGTTWVSNGIIGSDEDNYLGITGTISGNNIKLYMTRRQATTSIGGGELVTLTDASGYNGTLSGEPTILATASNQTAFRGVAFAPISPAPASILLSTKAFLQGDYSIGLGRHKDVTVSWATTLNANALNQPYSGAPFNYSGTETVTAGFFTSTAATTDIVDWVLLELHDATTPATIVARQAAFIREDGMVVGLDGTSNPSFTGVTAGNYYIVLRHRNHLAIRSSATVDVNGGTPTLYDFTTDQAKAYQNSAVTTNAAMKDLGGAVFGMWGGNVNANANTRYSGSQADAAAILAALSGNQAAILNNVYNPADVNFDGKVKYTGPYNDAISLLSFLSANQDAVITEHQ